MAKKGNGGKGGPPRPPEDCRMWLDRLKMDPIMCERLHSLKAIVEDDDTCEMPQLTITRVRKGAPGQRKGLWVVGTIAID